MHLTVQLQTVGQRERAVFALSFTQIQMFTILSFIDIQPVKPVKC